MKFGFIKVMAASPKLKVGDTAFNLESARECFDEAERMGANLLVFPELHLTAYTCGDLFYSDTLLDGALEALEALRDYTSGKRCMAVIGVPVRTGGKLYTALLLSRTVRCLELCRRRCCRITVSFMRSASSALERTTAERTR